MNVKQKLNSAKQTVRSISRHDDEDSDVRVAVLQGLKAFIDTEITAIDERVQTRITAMTA